MESNDILNFVMMRGELENTPLHRVVGFEVSDERGNIYRRYRGSLNRCKKEIQECYGESLLSLCRYHNIDKELKPYINVLRKKREPHVSKFRFLKEIRINKNRLIKQSSEKRKIFSKFLVYLTKKSINGTGHFSISLFHNKLTICTFLSEENYYHLDLNESSLEETQKFVRRVKTNLFHEK